MSKCTPTTKSCDEINKLINGSSFSTTYVQTLFDPVDTHGLYNVSLKSVDLYKDRIKSIGGKYIRVTGGRGSDRRIICFALEITPEEEAKVKAEEEAKARYKAAYESKLEEINYSILISNAGGKSERGKQNFAQYLLDPSILDPLLPMESYAFIDDPKDKDEMRIVDIVRKANDGCPGCVGMITTNMWKMKELAIRMNNSITDEVKRIRRHNACLKYGLKFLADCFVKTNG